jgi:hypothetical protein
MTKTVVFLGAGASKAFGLPLTGENTPAAAHAVERQKIA